MKKIKTYLSYETNPITFLLWFHLKQAKKFYKIFTDPSYKASRLY